MVPTLDSPGSGALWGKSLLSLKYHNCKIKVRCSAPHNKASLLSRHISITSTLKGCGERDSFCCAGKQNPICQGTQRNDSYAHWSISRNLLNLEYTVVSKPFISSLFLAQCLHGNHFTSVKTYTCPSPESRVTFFS